MPPARVAPSAPASYSVGDPPVAVGRSRCWPGGGATRRGSSSLSLYINSYIVLLLDVFLAIIHSACANIGATLLEYADFHVAFRGYIAAASHGWRAGYRQTIDSNEIAAVRQHARQPYGRRHDLAWPTTTKWTRSSRRCPNQRRTRWGAPPRHFTPLNCAQDPDIDLLQQIAMEPPPRAGLNV